MHVPEQQNVKVDHTGSICQTRGGGGKSSKSSRKSVSYPNTPGPEEEDVKI